MKLRKEMLILTPRGAEELHKGTFQFDVTAKNILTLIEQGASTTDMVLQRSMFPHNAVTACLHRLVRNKSVAVVSYDGSASQSGVSDTGSYRGRNELHLNLGVSVSQARFALSNFCMDNFDSENQYLVDAISLCVDIFSLQEVVNTIRADVDELCPGRLPALIACVRELNETDEAGATPAPARAAPSVARWHPEPTTPAASKPPPSPSEPKVPPAGRLSAAQPEPAKRPATASAPSTEPPRLEAAISLAQARFALTEFCLNEFGVQCQAFVDAVNRAGDVPALQKALNLIRTETLNRHRAKLPILLACVQEINETAL
ncbi:MAG: hypothetical protein M3O26_10820 [Pseudomonadota bacterium]|nr:hypothetical protein [Pseudomonadota bacterium]